ncbi:glycosyltransferase family protein [Shouchella tritolerans]|uniref:glycosyltransferase family protein n=1 Tax=Shouchella tritolerans TaxID=2979466 RepID=UPI0021E94181|nr:glycosyltransferase [Shouchella tritolerans]
MKKKRNVLFVTRDDTYYTVPASYYFIRELSQLVNLKVTHESGSLEQIIEHSQFEPDFVYLHDFLENKSPFVTGLKSVNIPFAVGLHDLHYYGMERKRLLIQEDVKHIFTYYRAKFLEWYSELADRMRWLPHHANTDVYQDYKQEKEIDLLMSGAMFEQYYPFRNLLFNRLKDRSNFVYLSHPGYRSIDQNEPDVYVGEKYARQLNRAKICLTCHSIYRYPLMKYFEITACNSLLLAPYTEELADLGFIPGVHFVSIDENNFEEKAAYYLKHEHERQRISLNGMRLVHEQHSTKKRAVEFVAHMEDILKESQLTKSSFVKTHS